MTYKRGSRGRFTKGTAPGPGRPKGLHLRSIAAERGAQAAVDLEGELWKVVLTLIRLAQEGDVAAARLLLDRLVDDHSSEQAVPQELLQGPPEPPLPDLVASMEVVRLMHLELFGVPGDPETGLAGQQAVELAKLRAEGGEPPRPRHTTPKDLRRVRRPAPVDDSRDELGQALPPARPKYERAAAPTPTIVGGRTGLRSRERVRP